MSNDFTQLNPGSGGDYMDETGVTYSTSPTLRKRARVVVTGEGLSDIAEVKDSRAQGDEMGLVVRQVVPNYPGDSTVIEDDVTLVPSGVETTIVTYTVPAGKVFGFLSIVASGDAHGVYRLYINSQKMITVRSSVANPTAFISYSFSPFSASSGSIVELRITHNASVNCDFEGSLIGYILDNANN